MIVVVTWCLKGLGSYIELCTGCRKSPSTRQLVLSTPILLPSAAPELYRARVASNGRSSTAAVYDVRGHRS